MNKNILYLAAATLMITASCSKFLDVKPVGKLIPTEIDQFNNILYGYATLDYHFSDYNRGCALVGLADNVYMTDNTVKYYYNPTRSDMGRFTTYTLNYPYLDWDGVDYGIESGVYKAVGLFNNVIDGIKSLGKENDPYGREVIAQARAARAWSLLQTGITYGPMYVKGGANDKKSIPYRMSADVNDPIPNLSTTAELFELVKKDLDYALEFCPERVINPTRANKAVADALSALMYMYMGDFENMYIHSKAAWEAQLKNNGNSAANLIYNFNEFKYETRTPPPTVEAGFDVETALLIETPDDMHNRTYNKENLFYRVATSHHMETICTPEYLSIFKDGDMRKKLFLLKARRGKITLTKPDGTKFEAQDPISLINYRQSKITANMGITHPLLLLMYAEAAARTNKTSEAMSALRTFRTFRYTPETASINDLAGDALIMEILTERRREQPVYTPDRYWDLKRFAVEDASKPWVKKVIKRTILGKEYSVDLTSEKYNLDFNNARRAGNPHWGLPLIPGRWTPYPFGNPFDN